MNTEKKVIPHFVEMIQQKEMEAEVNQTRREFRLHENKQIIINNFSRINYNLLFNYYIF